MQCPRCQSEIADWHNYCPNCHLLVQDYFSQLTSNRRSLVERVGTGLINLLLIGFIIGGSVLIARMIKWDTLVKDVRGAIDPYYQSVDAIATPAETPNPRAEKGVGRRKSNVTGKAQRSKAGVKTRAEDQKSEEKPQQEVVPGTTEPLLKIAGESGSQPSNAGLVTIKGPAQARVYIDGQYSGISPLELKLIPGNYQIKLMADGYEDWTRTVTLKNRGQTSVEAPMKKKSAP